MAFSKGWRKRVRKREVPEEKVGQLLNQDKFEYRNLIRRFWLNEFYLKERTLKKGEGSKVRKSDV